MPLAEDGIPAVARV